MIEFLYIGRYDDSVKRDSLVPVQVDHFDAVLSTTTEVLLCNIRVNAIADYYDTPPLK